MAYTIDKVGGDDKSKHAEIFGYSTDIKPTDVKLNDLFIEFDTGSAYAWNGSAWVEVGNS